MNIRIIPTKVGSKKGKRNKSNKVLKYTEKEYNYETKSCRLKI